MSIQAPFIRLQDGEVVPFTDQNWVNIECAFPDITSAQTYAILCNNPSFNFFPTASASAAPTQQPTLPFASPTNTPTASPTTPTEQPTDSPTFPTSSPTSAPSEAPTPEGPTPSPTNSDHEIFLDKMGSDSGCCGTKPNACLTIDYAYNLFLGSNGCDGKGYNGNGIIYLGDGDWHWPSDHKLIYDNEQVVINGNGMSNTTLHYDRATGIGCKWKKCWFEINDLALAVNKSNLSPNKQIMAKNGGTLRFSNVLFDGDSTVTNTQWRIEGQQVHLVIDSCVFQNIKNDNYHISNGAYVKIINSNFINNAFNGSLFEISSGSSLFVINTTFKNNTGHSIITTNESALSVSASIFQHNQVSYLLDITDRISTTSFECPSEDSVISVTSTSFIGNQVTSIITIEGSILYTESIINNNTCSDFCVDAVHSSLFMDLKYELNHGRNSSFNLINFNPQSDTQTLCINGSDIERIARHLSFDDGANINNAKVKFNNCPQQFSFTIPEISANINAVKTYLSSSPGQSVLKSLECYQNISTCAINCNDTVSCFASTFVVNSQTTNIRCDSSFACAFGTIDATKNTNDSLESVHIICDEDSSCFQAEITAESVDKFILDCITPQSCLNLQVTIKDTNISEINCYTLSLNSSFLISLQ